MISHRLDNFSFALSDEHDAQSCLFFVGQSNIPKKQQAALVEEILKLRAGVGVKRRLRIEPENFDAKLRRQVPNLQLWHDLSSNAPPRFCISR
jgi:hypothetical protein